MCFGWGHQAPLLFLPAMEGQEEGPEDVPELEKLEEVEVPPRRWVDVNPRNPKKEGAIFKQAYHGPSPLVF